MVVLDTDVVSEMMRSDADPTVLDWFATRDSDELFTTAITMAEVAWGIERLTDGERKDRLRSRAASAFLVFADRVLPFDASAAREHPYAVLSRQKLGLPIGALEAQIAAICVSRGATLATRSIEDFAGLGIDLVNPWTA